MRQSSKAIVGTLLAGGAVAAYFFVRKMQRVAINLEAVPSASVHKISLSGVTLRLDVLLKNPTKGSFTVKFPFVKLNYKGKTVGSSQVVNKDIKIPAFGHVMIDKIMIDIPLSNAISVISALITSLLNKEKVNLSATIITTATAGLVSLPFEKTSDLSI